MWKCANTSVLTGMAIPSSNAAIPQTTNTRIRSTRIRGRVNIIARAHNAAAGARTRVPNPAGANPTKAHVNRRNAGVSGCAGWSTNGLGILRFFGMVRGAELALETKNDWSSSPSYFRLVVRSGSNGLSCVGIKECCTWHIPSRLSAVFLRRC